MSQVVRTSDHLEAAPWGQVSLPFPCLVSDTRFPSNKRDDKLACRGFLYRPGHWVAVNHEVGSENLDSFNELGSHIATVLKSGEHRKEIGRNPVDHAGKINIGIGQDGLQTPGQVQS